MANEVNIYSPRYLAEVVRQTPAVHTYFRDTFFHQRQDVRYRARGHRPCERRPPHGGLCPSRVGGKVLKANGYQTESYKPPLINPYDVTTADQLMTRLPGEDLYSGMTPRSEGRAEAHGGVRHTERRDHAPRGVDGGAGHRDRHHSHCGRGGVNETIDFGLTNKKTPDRRQQVGAAPRPTSSATSVTGRMRCCTAALPTWTLSSWARRPRQSSFADANVQKMLDNRRMNLGEIAPPRPAQRREVPRPPE